MLKEKRKYRQTKMDETTSLSTATSDETKHLGLSQKETGTEPLLYDSPRKLNVQTFYEIMETENLELLKVNPNEEVSEQRLNDVWLDLLEFYYTNTNQLAFKKFSNNIKNIVSIEQELVACYAAVELIKLGDETGYEYLRKFKINDTDADKIRSAILRKETKLELTRSRMKDNGKQEKLSFYKIVSSVENALNRQMNLAEINLERWIAYLNDVKEKQEALKKQGNKKGKKWQGK